MKPRGRNEVDKSRFTNKTNISWMEREEKCPRSRLKPQSLWKSRKCRVLARLSAPEGQRTLKLLYEKLDPNDSLKTPSFSKLSLKKMKTPDDFYLDMWLLESGGLGRWRYLVTILQSKTEPSCLIVLWLDLWNSRYRLRAGIPSCYYKTWLLIEGLLTERGELMAEGLGRDRKKNVKSFQMLRYELTNPNSRTRGLV